MLKLRGFGDRRRSRDRTRRIGITPNTNECSATHDQHSHATDSHELPQRISQRAQRLVHWRRKEAPLPDSVTDNDEHKPLYLAELERVNGFIARFGQAAGASLDPLDRTGFSELQHGNLSVGITANPEHDLLLFLVRVADLPKAPTAAFLRNLLELNFMATGPCAFAIDSSKNHLYLRALRPLTGLCYEEFELLLQTIAIVGESMLQRLAEH
jgi:hypothetical protein